MKLLTNILVICLLAFFFVESEAHHDHGSHGSNERVESIACSENKAHHDHGPRGNHGGVESVACSENKGPPGGFFGRDRGRGRKGGYSALKEQLEELIRNGTIPVDQYEPCQNMSPESTHHEMEACVEEVLPESCKKGKRHNRETHEKCKEDLKAFIEQFNETTTPSPSA